MTCPHCRELALAIGRAQRLVANARWDEAQCGLAGDRSSLLSQVWRTLEDGRLARERAGGHSLCVDCGEDWSEEAGCPCHPAEETP